MVSVSSTQLRPIATLFLSRFCRRSGKCAKSFPLHSFRKYYGWIQNIQCSKMSSTRTRLRKLCTKVQDRFFLDFCLQTTKALSLGTASVGDLATPTERPRVDKIRRALRRMHPCCLHLFIITCVAGSECFAIVWHSSYSINFLATSFKVSKQGIYCATVTWISFAPGSFILSASYLLLAGSFVCRWTKISLCFSG